MKKILTVLIALLSITAATAQETTATAPEVQNAKVEPKIITLDIPQKMNIKDNIIVQNLSPYIIVQMAIATDEGNGKLQQVASGSFISSGEKKRVANFRDNGLKKLRGKRLVIKLKGAKISTASMNSDGTAPTNEKEIAPSLTTNDFKASLFEADHDLYIKVENDNFMDF